MSSGMLLLLELERRCYQLLCSVLAWSHIVQKETKFPRPQSHRFSSEFEYAIAGCPTSNIQFNSFVKHGTEIYKLIECARKVPFRNYSPTLIPDLIKQLVRQGRLLTYVLLLEEFFETHYRYFYYTDIHICLEND